MSAGTYTSNSGLTPQGTQNQSLIDLLSQITSVPQSAMPNVSSQQVGQAAGTAANYQAQMPGQLQQTQQNLIQQSGIPNLQSQQGNLAQLFPLYLADQNLGQKYSSSQLASGNSPLYAANLQANASQYTGQPSAVPNPYLASPQAIVNAVTQPSGQGFQGFTNPNLDTQAIGQVPQAAGNMINLLNQAIGTEQGLVSQKTADAGIQQGSTLSLLNSITNILGQAYASQGSAGQNALATPGTTQNAGNIFNSIIDAVQTEKAGQATEYDVWSYINQHDAALRDQGVNVDELWRLHKDLATKVGTGGSISGGTKASSSKFQAKKLPNGTLVNFNPTTGKYSDPSTGKQLTITNDQLQAAQDNAQTAQEMMKAYQQAGVLRFVPGSEHFIPGVAQAQSKLFQSLGSLRRGAIGGRITQQEISWLTAKLFPAPFDTDAVMQTKVQSLQDSITKFISDPNAKVNSDGTVSTGGSGTTGGSRTNQSDPLGIL